MAFDDIMTKYKALASRRASPEAPALGFEAIMAKYEALIPPAQPGGIRTTLLEPEVAPAPAR